MGKVAYVHAPGVLPIDEPVAILRSGMSGEPSLVTPDAGDFGVVVDPHGTHAAAILIQKNVGVAATERRPAIQLRVSINSALSVRASG